MAEVEILAERLVAKGFAVTSLEQVTGGCICIAGIATLRDGGRIFAKTLANADVFDVEAAGLSALARLGGVRVPAVVHASTNLLVLEALCPRGEDEQFWEQLARMVAALHTSTVSDRFGWHRDGWHGRMRQENAWSTDGYEFFAEHRILRWLREELVLAEFDRDQRTAVERLCSALPELVPPHPPSLTHGDMWPGNILADGFGMPALIDPAVSFSWPEIDLAALWCQPRPPASGRFFAVYEELARPCEG
ncbi:fructosamine kinase family protein [Nocardia bhagyanarayanae]|uniref:Fructosamine-3-kinase n=1 Tax=Nocardia bhagyanarayanae TaxID=1215925 RepID=A0A543FHS8_9NOCA|nr:fructosamine kinase family protein [Nocardia bhagyanarayanae]TQM33264.1 fructosamine-3-kinase [Nocardia bhagyanarayanae]